MSEAQNGELRESSGYRAEIDGLRGIAVLAVILSHAQVPGFSGGYAGVDVFFVVSGYLITRFLVQRRNRPGFSLIAFYERRLRRIMPALLVMLAASTVAGCMLLPPDLKRFSASLVAVNVFLSNVLFRQWSDYFKLAAESTPLLHTWSLAVEEQFYIAFPLGLLVLQASGRRAAMCVISLTLAVSFGYGLWATGQDPGPSFYSPLTRAWEFMAGALLVIGSRSIPANRAFNEVLGAAGLAFIAYAIRHLTQASVFPGLNAVLPCVGAVMVIRGTEVPGSTVARLLCTKPLVLTGLISYSLYLWHWPLIVFGTYYVLDDAWLPVVRGTMAAAAFPVAFLSWRYVECPFRGPDGLLSRKSLFACAFALSAAFAAIGATGYRLDGIPQRFTATVQSLSAAARIPVYPCVNQPPADIEPGQLCVIGDPAATPSFVLWGDSHAAVYHSALDAMARAHGLAGYSMTAFGCPPLLDLPADNPAMRTCRERNDRVIRALTMTRPRVAILAAHWQTYFDEPLPLNSRGKHGLGYPAPAVRLALEKTAIALRGLGSVVYFVEDVPQNSLATPGSLAKAHVLGSERDLEPRAADYWRRISAVATAAAALEQSHLLRVIEPARILCGGETCRVTDGGAPLYFDSNHLNERGALLVSPVFEPAMRQLVEQNRVTAERLRQHEGI